MPSPVAPEQRGDGILEAASSSHHFPTPAFAQEVFDFAGLKCRLVFPINYFPHHLLLPFLQGHVVSPGPGEGEGLVAESWGWTERRILSSAAGLVCLNAVVPRGWWLGNILHLEIYSPARISWRDSCQRDLCGACTVPRLAGDLVLGGIQTGTGVGTWGGGEARPIQHRGRGRRDLAPNS